VNPAPSVIFFTTLSGLGYGLAFWLAVARAFGAIPADTPWFGAISLGVALALVSAGLLSSTAHLGHPERAWRAFSQWRTSWLSREGVAAVVTFIPLGLLWLAWMLGATGGIWAFVALIGAVLALITVYCTGMIYQSLKPIQAWATGWTTPIYLLFALMTGAHAVAALAAWFGYGASWQASAALILTVVLAIAKFMYWHSVDTATPFSTPESATGLGRFGKIRQLEAPHVTENYITREMGFKVARKHAAKLRMIVYAIGFGVPTLVAMLMLVSGPSALLATIGVLAAMVGVIAERWLFFAEAKHAVMNFYGER
jgi:sulfite dehydrogenase (quinone) subunit SoeC